MARVKGIYKGAKVALSIPVVMAAQSVLMRTSPTRAKHFAHRYSSWLNKTMTARVHINGTPVKNEPCLMVANHASWQDIFLIGGSVPVSFVAKSDVKSWPVIGTLARMAGTVFVDRTRRQSSGNTKNEMQQRLENGETLVLFPEGTTSDGSQILPFKSALFGASQLEVDGKPIKVQPVTVAYKRVWNLPMARAVRNGFAWAGDVPLGTHLWNNLKSGPIDVSITFHEPMTVNDVGGRKVLAKLSEEIIREGLAQELANCRLN